MTPWLALSLGLWLGQTPEQTSSLPADGSTQDPAALQLRDAWERALANADATGTGQGTGGSGTGGTSDSAQGAQATGSSGGSNGSAGNTRQQVEQLRAQVQSLQSQLAAQQEESAANAQGLQQQLTGIQDRAAGLERLRQQRLAELDHARNWMVAADQALEVGDMAIGDALGEADSALAQVLQSASATGGGQTVSLIEDARGFIAQALESTGHRDTLQARQYLFAADWRVREARRQNLDVPSATVVTQ
ncbi:MAG: hypothetical protein ACJ8AT_38035 [Hyalangium sp.]|uniref:hypothetical protein n=1 Tax=Hyalangium sp. TaxID=2028555 RepID=UPI00389A2FF6